MNRLQRYLGLLMVLLMLIPASLVVAQDEDYVDCEVEVDAPECEDIYYVDCTFDIDDPDCDWADNWYEEGYLPAWYAEDAYVIECTIDLEEPECAWGDDAFFDEWGDGYLSFIDYGDDGYFIIFEPFDGEYGDWDEYDDEFLEESDADLTYEVSGDELFNPVALDGDIDPQEEQDAFEIWSYVTAIIPIEWLGKISKFAVFASSDDTAAYVYPDEANPGQWVLGVSSTELEDIALLQATIIHEFAHILTLDPDQFEPSFADGGSCSTVDIEEGCALSNSYLNDFYEVFWAEIDDEFQAIMQLDEAEQTDALQAFYEKYRNRFVSDYASSNIVEDMAESFASFVTRERPRGGSIADQKILFFYNYPELVELRDAIRARL